MAIAVKLRSNGTNRMLASQTVSRCPRLNKVSPPFGGNRSLYYMLLEGLRSLLGFGLTATSWSRYSKAGPGDGIY